MNNENNIENTNVDKKRNLILFENMWKTLLLISLPVALTSMITEVFVLFDVYFSKTIGNTAMEATVFVGPITSVILAISLGLGVAATALIAKALALKDFAQARKIHVQMIIITAVVSILALFVCTLFSELILKLGGASGDMLEVAQVYFKLMILSLPLRFFNDIYIGQQRAVGNNRRIMIVNFISIVMKFSSSFILIIVMKSGIEGLGISTLISSGIVTLFALYDCFIKKDELRITKKDIKLEINVVLVLISFALPIIIEKSTQSFGNVIVNSYATGLGGHVLSAYGVINKFNSVIFSFSSGFGAALVSIVSQNITMKNIDRIKEAKTKAIILSVSIVSFCLLIFFIFKEPLARIYAGDNEELLNSIISGMNVYTISAIPWTIMHIYFGLFQGMKKPKYVLIVSVIRLWVFRVFLVYLLLEFTNMGEYAIWYGMLISNILAMTTSIIIYKVSAKSKMENLILEIV